MICEGKLGPARFSKRPLLMLPIRLHPLDLPFEIFLRKGALVHGRHFFL